MTIKDVAAAAGVSSGTVSNVLNHPELVRPDTRARVEAAIASTGFVPHASARHLGSGRSDIVAFLVPDAANPFFTDIARVLRARAHEVGLSLILCDAGYNAEVEDRYLDELARMRVLGGFLASPRHGNPRLKRLRQQGVRLVFFDQLRDGHGQWCGATVDDVRGGVLAAEHLVAQGRHRIAYVGGTLDIPQVVDRVAGARQGVESSLVPNASLTVLTTPSMTVRDGLAAGARIVAEPASRRPTGIFCGNDLVALGLLHQLLRAGVKVPDEVALVGFDNIEFAETAVIPLTSVAPPVELLAREAVSMLIDEVGNDTHEHRQVLYPPRLVVRGSSVAG
jgi:LacI family transcriptional regulator